MKSTCLAILNYNGIHHLKCMLPTVLEAVAAHPRTCRALVLDNGSTQGDVQWIRGRYPEIEAVSAPANDCLFSYNWLIPRLSEDIVVLLNNDLRLTPDFVHPLRRHFDQDDVFAVSATSLDWEGKRWTFGPARLTHQHGWYRWGYDTERQELSHTLFASGGFSAVDRRKFVALGGFNRLFYPAYCEDLDLCFRAWRRGWRSLFEPASVVFHRDHGSWGEIPEMTVAPLSFRGQLLFAWLALPPSAGLLERNAMLAWVLFYNCRRGNRWCLRVWRDAVRTWLKSRRHYRWMKATSAELAEIQRRISEPAPCGQEVST